VGKKSLKIRYFIENNKISNTDKEITVFIIRREGFLCLRKRSIKTGE
jgi:hypothetical protein